jgi:mannonate dehydratase
MVNLHLDLSQPNFGIQEYCDINPKIFDVFDGYPELVNGFIYPNDRPGIGVEMDEKAAAKYPPKEGVTKWTHTRLPDGGLQHP